MSTNKCPCCGEPWDLCDNVELNGVSSDGHLDLILTCNDCNARFNAFVLVSDFTDNPLEAEPA